MGWDMLEETAVFVGKHPLFPVDVPLDPCETCGDSALPDGCGCGCPQRLAGQDGLVMSRGVKSLVKIRITDKYPNG